MGHSGATLTITENVAQPAHRHSTSFNDDNDKILDMPSDEDSPSNIVPTLVWFAQRVAVKYLDSIDEFGSDLSLRYDLLKPILDRCSAEELLKLERNTPQVECYTQDLWQSLCLKTHPIETQKCLTGEEEPPESWKTHYVVLQERAQQRLEAIGSKMRHQRLAFESQKKEREVKLTDRVPPPPKRSRPWGWGAPTPKTLMQKTVSEASKIQRNVHQTPFHAQRNAPRVLTKPSVALLPAPSPLYANRVTVNTVTNSRPWTSQRTPPSSSTTSSSMSSPPPTSPTVSERKRKPDLVSPPTNRPLKRQKRDPMAALFLPKERAHSQRSTVAR